MQAALPHAAAPLAGLEGTGRRRVGWRFPAGWRTGRQAALPRAAPPPPPLILLPSDSPQGLDAGLGGGSGAGPAGLPGCCCTRHRHECGLYAAAAGAAAVRGRQAHDGRAAQQAARRCAARLVPPGHEPALRGVQHAVQCRRRRLLRLPGQRL